MREHFYSTYIVVSRTHTIYVGMTNDLFHHGAAETPCPAERYGCHRLVWFARQENGN
jgi:predicted GIY-YIG superfamily endonuclease